MTKAVRRSEIRFVLVRPRDPNNIGAVARAMANFGLSDLVLADPYPPVWREARSAVGAVDLLKRASALPLEEAVKGAALVLGTCGSARRLQKPVVSLPGLGEFLGERLTAGGTLAVLFGNEKTGLTRAELGHCHAVVRIPTAPEVPSMNLGQAAALLAYELSRGVRVPRAVAPDLAPAPAEQIEVLVREHLRAFKVLDYMQGVPGAEQSRRVRDALKRLQPCRKDAGLLLGILRRV
ncbi:MAG: RNA methyltransferase [Elusimicrobia bacterium]|nr:RNA methyltransferase [Elusimicrobiota bacterium]